MTNCRNFTTWMVETSRRKQNKETISVQNESGRIIWKASVINKSVLTRESQHPYTRYKSKLTSDTMRGGGDGSGRGRARSIDLGWEVVARRVRVYAVSLLEISLKLRRVTMAAPPPPPPSPYSVRASFGNIIVIHQSLRNTIKLSFRICDRSYFAFLATTLILWSLCLLCTSGLWFIHCLRGLNSKGFSFFV